MSSYSPSAGRKARAGSLVSADDKRGSVSSPVPRTVAQLREEESGSNSALNFLARRGSEAENSASEVESTYEEEAMANAERELAKDAEWKRIQQNTFTRWANEHLKQADKSIEDLETELSDGLKLIALIEVLSGKKMPRHNKRPNFRSQKLENVSIALKFLEQEGVTLVNIDSTDIVDCKLKLILGLIWTLILHYAISMPMWDGPPLGGGAKQEKTPKQRLMDWVKDKVPDSKLNNFTTDWNDGRPLGALVDSVAPGLCPDWEDWDPKKKVENAREAMDLADEWLNVPKLLTPEEITNPNIDEQSVMTYLSQFPNAKLKPGAPLRKKTNVGKVRAYGPGLEPTGVVAKAPAKFTVETFGAGDAEAGAEVVGPDGERVPCEVAFNNDRKRTYSCQYVPEVEGDHVVKVLFANREIPKSPYPVRVEGFAGDAGKVTAAGPGVEPEGVVVNKPTYFHIYAQDAGKGKPEVVVLDPRGRKDSVPVRIAETDEPEVYRCEYLATELGLHSVNVFFAGNPIHESPFGVKVSPASQPNKVWTSGKGLQPTGIRANETVDFQVHTEGAGEGDVAAKILGPGGLPVRAVSKKIDDHTTEYTYTPVKEGRHVVMVTFAGQEIPRSPFQVKVSPFKRSSIVAYGPGLKGGIVDRPAKFTVDTRGETGALGFNIVGPSQAQIDCADNGDGSADVAYLPTAVGEYAVHVVCDDEDIPGSPFMAQIVPGTDYDPDAVKVYGPGVENGVNPKEKTHFFIDVTDAGDAPLDVNIVDDLGDFTPDVREKSEGVFECTYQPREKQPKQTVMVNFGGVAVPGSPFRVQNDNPNDPSKVKLYGPGVEDGCVRARKPTEFTVDCTASGPGDLQVAVEPAGTSPSNRNKKKKSVPISMSDNKDGTHRVAYEPTESGTHAVTVTLDGKEVPQSPVCIDVLPGVDLDKVAVNDFEDRVFVDCTNEFEVDPTEALEEAGLLPRGPDDASSVYSASDASGPSASGSSVGGGKGVSCEIVGPSGEPVDTYVNKVEPDGPYHVSFVPFEEGPHDVAVKYDGEPLPESPYKVDAVYGSDPSRVKAYGDGLEKGIVDEPNTFIVATKNAGAGSLGLAIEGPSEAAMDCADNKDGTATVEYTPTEEGDYVIAVKFADEDIPGSPFTVPVSTRDGVPKPNAKKVRAYGPGLEPGNVLPGKPAHFTVDSSETGPAPVDVAIRDADGNALKGARAPVVATGPDGIHDVSYVPPPVGEPYEVVVAYNGDEIPGSPFAMTSNPSLEDVIDSPTAVKELESGNHPDYIYSKNGTGMQRKGSKDGHPDGSGGVADLVRNTAPHLGRERGGDGNDGLVDDDGVFAGPGGGKGARRKGSADSSGTTGGSSSNSSSRKSSRDNDGDDGGNVRPDSKNSLGGGGADRRPGSAADSLDGMEPGDTVGRKGSSSLGGARRPGSRDELDNDGRPGSRGRRPGSRGDAADSDSDDEGDGGSSRYGPGGSRKGSRLLGPDGRPIDGDLYGPDGRKLSSDKYGPNGRRFSSDKYGPDGRKLSSDKYGPDGRKLSGDKYGPDGRRLSSDRYGADGRPLGSDGFGPDGRRLSSDKLGPGGRRTSGDQYGPDGRPLGPDSRPLGPDGRPLGPDGRPLGPDGRPLGPDGRPLGPDGRPLGPDGRPLGPDGRPLGPDGRPLGPDGRPLGPDGRPLGPDGRPLGPDGRPLGPDGRPLDGYGPDGRKPSQDKYGPDGRLLGRDGLGPDGRRISGDHYGPDGRRISREGYGPDGRPLGKDGFGPDGRQVGRDGLGPDGRRTSGDNYGPDGRRTSGDNYGPDGRKLSGNKYGPDGRPLGDDGYGPDGRRISGSKYGPDGRPLGSDGYGPDERKLSGDRFGPDGRPLGSDKYGPDGRRISSSKYGPDGKPLGSHGYGPDGRPLGSDNLGPDGRPLGPDGYGPDGRKLSGDRYGPGSSGYGPDGKRLSGDKYGPDGRPVGSDGYGPDSRKTSANRYGAAPGEQVGPDGRPIGISGYGGPDSRKGSRLGDGPGGAGEYGPDGRRLSADKYGPDGRPLADYGYGPDGRRLSADKYGPNGRKVSDDSYGPDGRKTSSNSGYGPDAGRKGSGSNGGYGPDGSRRLGDYPMDGSRKHSGDRFGGPAGGDRAGPNSRYGPDGRKISDDLIGPDGRKVSSERYGNNDGRPGSRSDVKSPFGPGGSRPGSRSDVYGPGKDRFPPVELNNVPLPSTGGEVEAVVRTPSGSVAYPFVEDNGNGSIGLSYQPGERGPHSIDVRYDGDHVQGSPYSFYSAPLDDNRVHAHGPGLTHGNCGDPADFVISTRGAGAGGLALAVEGPSKADINCQDNKDGTVNVSYLPTAPGEYKISAKFADKHIEGSPFTCKVTGEGKKRNAISVGSSSDLSLPDNLSNYDLRSLNAYIIAPSGAEEPCFLKKLPKGNTGISFTPKEVGEHLVSVKREGKHIRNSPFKIKVSPGDVGDASKVRCSGRGLTDGRTHEDNLFHVDTRNAGYGGLSLSVEGPSKAEIKCKDHEDGTLDVSYRPTEPGLYIVNLKFADHHVPGSPFAVAVSGLGSKKEEEAIRREREAVPVTEVGSQCRLTFKMPGISASDLVASVSSPSGRTDKAAIAELEDGLFAVNFVPRELGIHTVSVKYHDIDIPGSPFQFTVGPLQDGGAHRVHAGGSGLERGVQGQPSDFNVWTREAGHGSLAISVEGPSKAVVDFKDRKDGSCHVSYTVEEPGEYSVGIRFNDQHIPGSPYRVYIQPSADDADRIRLSNVADAIKPDAPQTMLLNMNGADGNMECRIVAPSGREDDCFITPLGNGEHSVRFVPKEEGVHHLHARFNGVHIPGSPYKIAVGNANNNDPSTVEVYGKGVQYGATGKKSSFVIDTSSVGAGTLSITVDGPSKVDLSCNEVESGYEVSYTPMVPGKYYVTVKYNGRNVAGSPFSVNVGGDNLASDSEVNGSGRQRRSSRSSMTMETLKRTSYIRHQYTEKRTSSSTHSVSKQQQRSIVNNTPDPSQVQCSGSGLNYARLNRHNSFQVDCSRAGNNILYVGVYGPETPCDEVVIKHQGNKMYTVDYVVRERGKYIIFVKWGEDHVPGSPYHVEV